jgi:hypothetical protein
MSIPAYLRCYVDSNTKKSNFTPKNEPKSSYSIVLAFDTETTINQFQNLLFGSCGKWVNGKLQYFYLFHADDLEKSKVEIIKSYGKKYNYIVLSRREFVEKIFYPNIFLSRAKCVGFNLPFDLSRLAVYFGKSRKMKNGFTLRISENPNIPDIVIKSISRKASFIEFTRPIRKKSEKRKEHYKGCFVDLKTVTFALTNKSYSLKKALKDFGCMEKIDGVSHGVVSGQYVHYNVNDTLSTFELYQKCQERYKLYSLSKDISKLYSPASIGKAILDKINVKPFLEKNPEFSKKILGYVMSCYYGGRTEVQIRKEPVKVSYIDFTSMYPSIYCLFGMDKFLKAQKIIYKETTIKTQKMLEDIVIEDVSKKETWKNLTTICKIVPDNDILPVRSRYGTKKTTNIGINYLKSEDGTSLWYSLPDLIASKILSGKTPKILEAITFVPQGIQNDLQEIEVLKGITVNPEEDFIKKLIEERIRIKSEPTTEQNDIKQGILKIIANATSYGIYIETNSNSGQDKVESTVYGLDSFEMESDRTEDVGKFFHPIMSIFLTAGSRMILACAESLVKNNGGYMAYCDTDSVFVSPEHVKLVQSFFRTINPYSVNVEMFKVEKDKNEKKLHDVWFYGISAKRYVLYDYDNISKSITIRKHSAHGLGHLVDVDEKQWWHDILSLHYGLEYNDSKYSKQYAVSQLTVSNYDIYKRFAKLNHGKSLSKTIKPFNFITVGSGYKTDFETRESIIPMMPYVEKSKTQEAPYREFLDYKTGKSYPNEDSMDTKEYWKPMSEVFSDYVRHNDAKSEGKIGLLRRRRLTINSDSIHYIGKESNELEKSDVMGVSSDDTIQYVNFQKKIRENIVNLDLDKALEIGISRRSFFYLKTKLNRNTPITLKKKNIRKILLLYVNDDSN